MTVESVTPVFLMPAVSEDLWSLQNVGEENSPEITPGKGTLGDTLRGILFSDFETAIQRAREISPEIEEELREWDRNFPRLQITGKKLEIKGLPSPENKRVGTQRTAVAKRIVNRSILPELQTVLKVELNCPKSMPKPNSREQGRGALGRSKSTIATKREKHKHNFTLPPIAPSRR